MTRCACIRKAVQTHGSVPREQLPSWLRNPLDEEQFDIAIGVYGATRGIAPICRKGQLVAWRGIGHGVPVT